MSTLQPVGELPSVNYANQDTFYTWQQPIAPPSSEESTRQQLCPDPQPVHSSSHSQSASGSSLDQRRFQPLPVSGGSAYPHYTYCTVQAALIPVQGGYQYNPAQGMLPIQGAASCRSTPFVYSGDTARHRYSIIFLVVFCFLVFFLTVVIVIIFLAVRPTPYL